MGHIKIRLRIFSADHLQMKELELLIDTGAAYTWISRNILNELGIHPKGEKLFRMIDGITIIRDYGEALIEFQGETVTTIVVFAEHDDAQVVGVYALEGMGMEIDPIAERVKKAEVILAI